MAANIHRSIKRCLHLHAHSILQSRVKRIRASNTRWQHHGSGFRWQHRQPIAPPNALAVARGSLPQPAQQPQQTTQTADPRTTSTTQAALRWSDAKRRAAWPPCSAAAALLLGQGQLQLLQLGRQLGVDGALHVFFQVMQQPPRPVCAVGRPGRGQYLGDGGRGAICGGGVGQSLSGG